jgi:hypothetical protein
MKNEKVLIEPTSSFFILHSSFFISVAGAGVPAASQR